MNEKAKLELIRNGLNPDLLEISSLYGRYERPIKEIRQRENCNNCGSNQFARNGKCQYCGTETESNF